MAIALSAEYGDCSCGAISLIGSSCSARCPPSASHAVSAARSPISPMPQLAVPGQENSGINRPARRPSAALRMADSERHIAADITKNAVDAVSEHAFAREQAQDQERLARKIEEVSWMRQHTGVIDEGH